MFSKNTVVAAPTVAAAAPTKPASDVISLFSNSYTNVPIDTWRTSWSAATLTETQIASNDVKKYSGLDYVGIEMITKRLNINSMDSFEFDLWTPNSTTFKFKLVDFGADTSFGGGDDKEHELSITPTLNGWNHISVPISAFTGLTTKANIAQLIFASVP
ncbi:MAG: glycoside hydrolase family 16 protein, partial [Bacteroidota bacterium]